MAIDRFMNPEWQIGIDVGRWLQTLGGDANAPKPGRIAWQKKVRKGLRAVVAEAAYRAAR